MKLGRLGGLALLALGLAAGEATAAEVSVAVAANFTRPAEQIAAAFEAKTGDRVVLSTGSTGGLYAQIAQGAPFAVFLAADDKRPAQAVAEGHGVAGTVFTYAIGKTVLYSPGTDVTDGEAVLRNGDFEHIAVADPASAPYGAAAMQVIAALGLADALAPRIVTGENITQTLQFVESGNAELGFVALSQVVDKPAQEVWHLPQELDVPIRQDAVLLATAASDPTAKTFIEFLRSAEVKTIIQRYGYEVSGE